MSRLAPLDPKDMTPEQLDYYKKIRQRGTFKDEPEGKPLVGPFGAYQLSVPYARLKDAISDYMSADSLLPKHLVELTIIIAARHWMTDFAFCSHERGALREGVNPDAVAAIRNGTTPSFDKPDEQAAYHFLTQLLEQHFVDDATYQAVVDQIGEAALVEMIGLAGHYVTTCMTINAFEIPMRDGDVPLPRR